MRYLRLLQFQLPMLRGADVIAVQKQLKELGYVSGEPDGIFGSRTEDAVHKFQQAKGLRKDGKVGPYTWKQLFSKSENTEDGQVPQSSSSQSAGNKITEMAQQLLSQPSQFRDSVSWQLTQDGISISGQAPERTGGKPITVGRVWRDLRGPLVQWSRDLEVPLELIIATICTESGGRLDIVAREEPGYISDEETPHRVSPGIMQTLISTAREALGDERIDRSWLQQPANSIHAGTAYIASQWKKTHFDPPKVACAYNAGGVYYNDGDDNRWKMRQYPIGSAEHANRFVKWFNDTFAVLKEDDDLPDSCYVKYLKGP